MSNNNKTTRGTSMGDTVLIVFLILKLTKLINWSWWWVLSPLWVSVIVLFAIATASIIFDDNKF